MKVRTALGRYGEQVAADHLEAAGLRILERNWRCRDGELDIIAVEDDDLVVVEVKTRSSEAFGTPQDAVGRVKAARIRRLAVLWMDETRATRAHWPIVRFDVVSVMRYPGPGGVRITHLRGAF